MFYPKHTDSIFQIGKAGNKYRLDSFDKPLRLYESLKNNINHNINIIDSANVDYAETENIIASVHSPEFVNMLKTGIPSELANSSGIQYQEGLYDYIIESSICSKNTAITALKDGIAFSFANGGHHCEKDKPLGFCLTNNVAIAAKCLTEKENVNVAVIDLDVHYSNGFFDVMQSMPNVMVTSVWGQKIDKWKYFESTDNMWHRHVADAQEYFICLDKLINLVKNFRPAIILYHMGIDALETDRMGGIKNFNYNALLKRDSLIKNLVNELNCSIGIFRAGAYTDYSKTPDQIEEDKRIATEIQTELLSIYNG